MRRRRITLGPEGAAVLLGILSLITFVDGGLLLAKEYGRFEQGRLVSGVVSRKLSSSGADGSVTIGGRRSWRRGRLPTVVTANGFRFDDVLARVILTGSRDAWAVEYRYSCEAAATCWQREFVSRALWSQIQIGQTVNVRTTQDQGTLGRLDANPPWSTAIVKLAMAIALGVVALLVSGRVKARRQKLVSVPGIVTAVEPITTRDKVHWRVRFAYFSGDGTPRESADDVYVPGVAVGDNCTAVYPPDQPDLGSVRLDEAALTRRTSMPRAWTPDHHTSPMNNT